MNRSEIPAAMHAVGDRVHGFTIESVSELPDTCALAYQARHDRTGAEVLHVHCHDEENMFSIGFRTPPRDSTGVAHILEHSVLAGSRKYPVKDAFNELGKRSMSTFINAMTWPDRTIYPVCSAVRADYFNLAAVYADLVLNPLITEQTFRQEGHHFELADLDDLGSSLTISGVVYNEMKGAYSSPEQVVYRSMQQDLLPHGPYGVDAGGDPDCIPDLTYEDFRAFHRRYYSPSNARVMLYGDVPLADNLAFLAQVLAPFEHQDVDSVVPDEPVWSEPRRSSIEYPVGSDDTVDGKTFVTMSWRANETHDVETTFLLDVLCSALVGTAAGPMRRALIDSGLGQDIFPPAAYDADIRYGVVSFGLRGTEAESADQIETVVLDTLKALANKGIDRKLLEAALHQAEFGGKEIIPPFPIMLLIRANPAWYFGADPKTGLSFAQMVDRARRRWAAEPRLFESLIEERLLGNPHRLRLVTRPSATLAADRQAALVDHMAERKASMSSSQIEEIALSAKSLREAQQAPDSPEALASLPTLRIEDVPRRLRTVPSREWESSGVAVHEHEVFSNGVGYVGLAFDMRDLDDELARWVPIVGRATTGMGAAGLSYEQMATRIADRTGGVSASAVVGRELHDGSLYQQFLLDGSVLARHAGDLFGILTDFLTAPDPNDIKRLRDLLRENASRMTSRLIPAGSMFASMRAAASLDAATWRREQWAGVTQIRFLNELARASELEPIAGTVRDLQARVFCRRRLTIHMAGDAVVLDALRPHVGGLVNSLVAGSEVAAVEPEVPRMSSATGVVLPAEVNYVGQVLSVPKFLDPAAPALHLAAEVLSNDYLYQRLRVQGGAYGGFCAYSGEAGLLPMLSYRDPHLTETLEVYAGVPDFLRSGGLTDDAVAASRLGAIGSFDRVLSPAQQLQAARGWRLAGITDDDRMRYRDGLLAATADQIRQTALPLIEASIASAPKAILASRERLEAANQTLGGVLELFNPLPS